MGDGVSEMLALIVELCLEKQKIFVLEEPEMNLHPSGLKALLGMVRSSSNENQFIISTHSNIVIRELGGLDTSKIFRVFRNDVDHVNASNVEEVPALQSAHLEILRELDYEFADTHLYEAWLFLEESSAESIINNILLPHFASNLCGRLRTFSANGVANLERSISDFRRLIVFIHLQPVYNGRLWVRADGDIAGKAAVETILATFPTLTEEFVGNFSEEQFEIYYPAEFSSKVADILALSDRTIKRKRKKDLLAEVLAWSKINENKAIEAWAASAKEVIEFLRSIQSKLTGG
jgi:predicted ATP-dependent endonuclease of OLD family